ncbi:DUF2306 domain-containing protein [Arthrobacter castelli]|uniref:DUF2306 domain-containing protein n=1 Tax=Arthrobacter castelli TaxID=271431 RepID=UPI00040C1B1B|nr:DUF2306 domain-containing protein [Arthrobacter castelli]
MDPWTPLIAVHVIAASYVLVLGPVNIFRRRRDRIHKIIGFTWVTAIVTTCVLSFWIRDEGHFTWLHGLSLFTLTTVSLGVFSAVRGNIPAHRGNMIGSYTGTLIAFGFAAAIPGRRIPELISTEPATVVFIAALILVTAMAFVFTLRRTVPAARAAPRPRVHGA